MNDTLDNASKCRTIAVSLIDKACRGELDLVSLGSEWPDGVEHDVFYDELYDDLEDAAEHFPLKFFSKRPDWRTWKSSLTLKKLEIDRVLLMSKLETVTLNEIRQRVLTELEHGYSDYLALTKQLVQNTESVSE